MKNKKTLWLAALVLGGAVWLTPRVTFGQNETSVTGAGSAVFASGAVFNVVPLSDLRFGIGIDLAGDGTASGDVEFTLVSTSSGQSKNIVVEGEATSGSLLAPGVAIVSGTCSIDKGDGTLALSGVPFSLTVSMGLDGKGTLSIVLGAANLPAATVSKGSLTVR